MIEKYKKRWWSIVSPIEIDSLFANEALKHRAIELFRRDVCDFVEVERDYVLAQVEGSGGIYWVELSTTGNGISYDCTCPSDYYPCKHIGALLYTMQQAPEGIAEESTEAGDDDAGIRSGGRSEGIKALIDSEDRDIIPGEVLEIVSASGNTGGGNRFSPRGARLELPGRGETIGTVSRGAQFRPAFRFTRTPTEYRPSKKVLGVEPVLVYMRKDGADGRIERFNPRKKRVEGDEETESLLRTWSDRGARPLRAVDLCSFWYEETIRHGGKGLRPPVELFLERAGRVDREHAALPRRINRFAIRWSPEFNREGSLEYRPVVSFTDEEGHSEVYIEREMAYGTNGGALIVSNPNTGSLWYLFQSDLPQ
ncbi:MAG: SWIM zinc finger domain-containing protein, partial [Spirochaetaceae bacterium]